MSQIIKIMMGLWGFVFLAACQPSESEVTQALVPAEDDVMQQFLDLNATLENTAFRILTANVTDCPETGPEVGLRIHTIFDFPEDMRKEARTRLSIGPRPFVRHVIPDSPAEKAGLKTGDEILSIGEIDMIEGDRSRLFYEVVSRGEWTTGTTQITFKRGQETDAVQLTPLNACAYPVQLFFADMINAYTDGEEIWVTTELVNTIDAEESLAMIIAHELAHATEGHIFKTPTKAFELDADRLGMKYILAAGYDGQLALAQWSANPLNHKSQIEDTHPVFEERWRAIDKALQDFGQE